MALMEVLLSTVASVAPVPPNLTVAPARKFAPEIVTTVPPPVEPVFGVTTVTTGRPSEAGFTGLPPQATATIRLNHARTFLASMRSAEAATSTRTRVTGLTLLCSAITADPAVLATQGPPGRSRSMVPSLLCLLHSTLDVMPVAPSFVAIKCATSAGL